MEIKKKVLLIAPSISNSSSQLNGIKIKIIQQIKTKLDKYNISITIATFKGADPIINYQNDESSKIWANNTINKDIEIIDIKNIDENEFSGIIIPSFSSIFKEINIEGNKLTYTLSKLNFQNKIICCLGHGTYCLTKVKFLTNSSKGMLTYKFFNILNRKYYLAFHRIQHYWFQYSRLY
jgi:hypothetical protein